jgi:hypothetical protein
MEFRFLEGFEIFSLHRRVQTVSGAHPASYLMGIGVLTPEAKRPECEADD